MLQPLLGAMFRCCSDVSLLFNNSVCSCLLLLISQPHPLQHPKLGPILISWTILNLQKLRHCAGTGSHSQIRCRNVALCNPGARDVSELRLKPRWKPTTTGSDSWLISLWANGFSLQVLKRTVVESGNERATSLPSTPLEHLQAILYQ